MKFGLGQFWATLDVSENASRIAELISDAHRDGIDLLGFSELALTGYDMGQYRDGTGNCVGIDHQVVRALQSTVDLGSTTVLLGAAISQDDSAHMLNALLLLAPGQAPSVVYSKVHVWESERPYFMPGSKHVVLRIHGYNVGLGICYDAGFPEFSRHYGEYDIDLIFFSSAFARGAEEGRYNIYHPARALENNAYVAVCNALGPLGEADYYGRSLLLDAEGQILSDAGYQAGLTWINIDREYLENVREALPYLANRRTYRDIEKVEV